LPAATNLEIELKFPVEEPRLLRSRIRSLGFRVAEARRIESNWIFDDAHDSLRRGGRLLRLRRSGQEWTLTVKGKRQAGTLKQRPEFETNVGDGNSCRALLVELGYRERISYRRWRTTFERPRQPGELAWDETPFGIYLEIEGTAAWVRRTAAALGLAISAAEQRSYPELYAAHQGQFSERG